MKTILALALLTLMSAAEAKTFTFPSNNYNWTNMGGGVSISSNTSVWATGMEANGVCTYSYKVGDAPVVGPIQITAPICKVSTSSSIVNGVSTVIIKVNGSQVYPVI